jgi:hypothetical protein
MIGSWIFLLGSGSLADIKRRQFSGFFGANGLLEKKINGKPDGSTASQP